MNARLKRLHSAMRRALPFGIDNDRLAELELIEDSAHALLADAFLINGDGVEAADDRGAEAVLEQRLAGKINHRPTRDQAAQDRIEKALMIRDQQGRAVLRHVLLSLHPQAEAERKAPEIGGVTGLMPGAKPKAVHPRIEGRRARGEGRGARGLLGGDARSHFLFQAFDDLLRRKGRGVELDGVIGRHHRGDVAGGIAGVTLVLSRQDIFEEYGFATGGQLAVAAAGALHRIGKEEKLAKGVGKDDGPLIAPLADEVAYRGDLPLPGDQLAAHHRAGGDGRRKRR